MKTTPDSKKTCVAPVRSVRGLMIAISFGLTFTVCLLAGCSKRQSSAVESQAAATNLLTTPVSHQPVYVPSVVTPSTVTKDGGPDLGELNRCLLRWVMGHRRKPANFEEFAASANVTIPPAPTGKKYAINSSMHIILLNQ